jgi:hypothetical protein
MINLLASTAKEDILYARRNTILARWGIAIIIVIVGIGIISMAGIFFMRHQQKQVKAQIVQTESYLKDQDLEGAQKKVEAISTNLKLTTQVLSREILFSKLIRQIGSAMPAGTSLTNLKIGQTNGAIDLSASATDYNTATQVQINLQDPANNIFDKADILNINCTGSNGDPAYPCAVNIRARFGDNNQYLLIPKKSNKNE